MRVLKKVLKIGGIVLLGLFVLLLVAGSYLYLRARDQLYAEHSGDTPSVLQYYDETAPEPRAAATEQESPGDLFEPALFVDPDNRFGPWTRWWWPGNDVEPEELRREIRMFAEHAFGGVEIQPFTCGLDPKAPEAEQDRVYSYDTDAYFENLRVVMQAAREAGLGVDINAGGGWPSGGPHITPEDNFKTLAYSETTLTGGREVTVEIPRPSASFIYWAMGPGAGMLLPGLGGNMLYFYPDQAELLEVVAAPVVEDGRSSLPWKLDDQVVLDQTDVRLLRDQVDGEGRLTWTPPTGTWRIVGIWSMPDGEPPILIPTRDRGLVVDHFDRRRVIANYNYLFGERAGLAEFHGDPFRAIFNDSYEFKADRHFATGFLDEFEKRRGYDVRPWLPAMLRPGYDNMFATFMIPLARRAEFRFSDDDERVNYDYDLTISELLIERFLDTSSEWMGDRGLQHRTQAYGANFDIIRGMGHAQIPETEQLAGQGSEMFLRMASSGAELHNRPLVTSESLVWMGRDHMTTPQKAKIAVDKLFTSGINQVIFHGTAYRYDKEFYGEEGWQPFSSPAMGAMGFSSNISESDVYWEHQRGMNRYIARSQYVLRLGERATDVLVYYPFLGNRFRGQEGEHLARGVLDDSEPPLQPMPVNLEPPGGEQGAWEDRAWNTIRELDRQGISWAWINDDSLQAAEWKEGAIDIRGNTYQAVVLADVPWLQPDTAARLAELAEAGASVVVLGTPPARQPGYLAYEENDKQVAACSERILASETAIQLREPRELGVLAEKLDRAVAYAEPFSFLRHFERVQGDGSRLVFLWNTSDEDVRFQLRLSDDLKRAYWLDPIDGGIHAADTDSPERVTGSLGPYGSIILYAGARKEVTADRLSPPPLQSRFEEMVSLQTLDQWDLRAGTVSRTNTGLFDWRDDPELRHSSDLGTYTAGFTLEEPDPAQRYLVDLGSVHSTAEVRVNGQDAGTLPFSPYRLDVTDHLVAGENQIEVTVTPAPRNGFIGRALAGEKPYERFDNQADRLMSAGLAGPVRLLTLDVEG